MNYNGLMKKGINIKLIFLYLFTTIGLIITVIGLIQGIDLGIKTFVFKGADDYGMFTPATDKNGRTLSPEEITKQKAEYEKQMADQTTKNRQRQLSTSVAMIVIGLPLYLYHWRLALKENNKK